MIGVTIGHYYTIEELIGRGGMGDVYRARDMRFRRDVAIKVLPASVQRDPTFRQRFEREAQSIAGMEHTAIVPVYDYGEYEGQPYLVMRYMGGGSLSDRINNGPLSLAETVEVIDRIGSALDAAHEHGIIHRDVKPGNILFDTYGDAYLSDFGIVRLMETTAHLTGTGTVGTPAYMAPELADRGGLTPLVDIYALGVTLFQTLAGVQPYEADTPLGLIMAHISKPVPDIRSIQPNLPEDIQLIIEWVLAKDPGMRYQTASELVTGLYCILEGERPIGPAFLESMPLTTQPVPADALDEESEADYFASEGDIGAKAGKAQRQKQPRNRFRRIAGWVMGIVLLAAVAVAALGYFDVLPIPILSGYMVTPTTTATVAASPTITSTVTITPTIAPTDEIAPTETSVPTDAPTPTIADTPEPTLTEEERAINLAVSGSVTRNAEWPTLIKEIDGVSMALVPAGCFMMGNNGGKSDATPEHEVCITSPFWIDVTEVTNSQYGSLGCDASSYGSVQPRNCVNWDQAQVYCDRRGGRLPTEAEWEYAARGPDGRVYPWGAAFLADYVVYRDNAQNSISVVGSRPQGASWVGALDLSGNVWEWVSDWYDEFYYSYSPRENPQGPDTGVYRVKRGGSIVEGVDSGGLQASSRDKYPPEQNSYNIGFRCVRDY